MSSGVGRHGRSGLGTAPASPRSPLTGKSSAASLHPTSTLTAGVAGTGRKVVTTRLAEAEADNASCYISLYESSLPTAVSELIDGSHGGNLRLRSAVVPVSRWGRLRNGLLFDVPRALVGAMFVVEAMQLVQLVFCDASSWPWGVVDTIAWLGLGLDPLGSVVHRRDKWNVELRSFGGNPLTAPAPVLALKQVPWSQALHVPLVQILLLTLSVEVSTAMLVLFWYGKPLGVAMKRCGWRKKPATSFAAAAPVSALEPNESPPQATSGAMLFGSDFQEQLQTEPDESQRRGSHSGIVEASEPSDGPHGQQARPEMALPSTLVLEALYEANNSGNDMDAYAYADDEVLMVDLEARDTMCGPSSWVSSATSNASARVHALALRVISFVVLDAALLPILRVYLNLTVCFDGDDAFLGGKAVSVLKRAPQLTCWDTNVHVLVAVGCILAAGMHISLALWFASSATLAIRGLLAHPRMWVLYTMARLCVLILQVYEIGSFHLLAWAVVTLSTAGVWLHIYVPAVADVVPHSLLTHGRTVVLAVCAMAGLGAFVQELVNSRTMYVVTGVSAALMAAVPPSLYTLLWRAGESRLVVLEEVISTSMVGADELTNNNAEQLEKLMQYSSVPLYREFLFSSPLVSSLLHLCLTGDVALLFKATRIIADFAVSPLHARAFNGASAVAVIATYVVSASAQTPALQLEGCRAMSNLLSHGPGRTQFVQQGYMSLVATLLRRATAILVLEAARTASVNGDLDTSGRGYYKSSAELLLKMGGATTSGSGAMSGSDGGWLASGIVSSPEYMPRVDADPMHPRMALGVAMETLKILTLVLQLDIGREVACQDATLILDIVAVLVVATQQKHSHPLAVAPITSTGSLSKEVRHRELARVAYMALAMLAGWGTGAQRGLLIELGLVEIASRGLATARRTKDKILPLMLVGNLVAETTGKRRFNASGVTHLLAASRHAATVVPAAIVLHNLGLPHGQDLEPFLRTAAENAMPVLSRKRRRSLDPSLTPTLDRATLPIFQSPLRALELQNTRKTRKSLARRAVVNSALSQRMRAENGDPGDGHWAVRRNTRRRRRQGHSDTGRQRRGVAMSSPLRTGGSLAAAQQGGAVKREFELELELVVRLDGDTQLELELEERQTVQFVAGALVLTVIVSGEQFAKLE
ncbi:uncharacterized protein AMSG_06943 [Thecamonas trahens ATCC 50062]|uniref:Uncharacterized protein n=1 Tax=Thecamonas trahens ATCC 50062 TaxID=461836 RepID=A0A0L0DFN6_THETB|nr:hypothetical protein AMSG_06943 [Thecamonas trahens ATCC 50062]KNC50976.1 hypothetical protein AMSG_06943 [Thecamonas trahens ATCC 50062]|eukprot:XP_013756447.1 hypothetical protein AMSG_06943 [Thecamonas trahens ATCC 50062]